MSIEPWILAEEDLPFDEAHIAAHDYAHEGWFTRVVPQPDTYFSVYVRWTNGHGVERTRYPACCRDHAHTLSS